MKRDICLFDMDGTLTPPRKKIEPAMIRALSKLVDTGVDIGIVTGSDHDYIMQQCMDLFGMGGPDINHVDLFPCNGTKHYTSRGRSGYELIHTANMIDHIGQEDYNYLLQTLFANQIMISCKHQIPYTGTFFQYRDSMLNWCPIGRQAEDAERDAWSIADTAFKIREYYLSQLQAVIKEKEMDLTVALGGSTSFDIYPKGWDKTYVLNHLGEYDRIWFVGDRCQEGGNDKALYDMLNEEDVTDWKAFETDGPEKTIKLIDEIIAEAGK